MGETGVFFSLTSENPIFLGIRQLQCVLLKIALLLGVEIHENVAFTELVQPERGENGDRKLFYNFIYFC